MNPSLPGGDSSIKWENKFQSLLAYNWQVYSFISFVSITRLRGKSPLEKPNNLIYISIIIIEWI